MSRILRLGLRLALGGGREGLVRLVFMAVGVGVGVALLLLALTAPQALRGRSDRMAWQDAAYSALSPETTTTRSVESADGALFLAVSDYYDGRPMTRRTWPHSEPTRPYRRAWTALPGRARSPPPRRCAGCWSPHRTMSSTTGSPAGSRSRSAPTGWPTTTSSSPSSAGRRTSCGAYGRWARSTGSPQVRPTGWAIVALLVSSVLAGAVLVLVPVVILIVVVTRVAWRQRERRLAAIRLVGATQPQTAVVAAAEAGLAAVGGAALGWGLYEVGRRVLAATVTFQGGHFWVEDVAVAPRWLAAILRRHAGAGDADDGRIAAARPVRVRSRCSGSRGAAARRSGWRCRWSSASSASSPCCPSGTGSRCPAEAETRRCSTLVALLTLIAIVGFVLIGPWLVAMVGQGVARLSRGVPSLLAARRIAADPYATFYSVAVVGLAAVALAYVGCTVAASSSRPLGRPDGPWNARLRPGVVPVLTGGVPAATVAPLLSTPPSRWASASADRGVVRGLGAGAVRVVPAPPGLRVGRAGPRQPRSGRRSIVYIPTDGTLAAENRARTQAANLVPNAIINTDRDPSTTTWRRSSRLRPVGRGRRPVRAARRSVRARRGDDRRPHRAAAPVRAAARLRRVPERTAPGRAPGDRRDHGGDLGPGRRARHAARVRLHPAGRHGLALAGAGRVRLIGGGVLAALLFSTLALPLLGLTTRHDAVRFD